MIARTLIFRNKNPANRLGKMSRVRELTLTNRAYLKEDIAGVYVDGSVLIKLFKGKIKTTFSDCGTYLI